IAGPADDLILASLDADPHPDLVVASGNMAVVTVFRGDGNGMFVDPEAMVVDVQPDSLAVGDVDGDGKVDVVFASSADNMVGVMLGNGDTTFGEVLLFDV